MRQRHLQLQRRRPVALRILLSLQLEEDAKMRILRPRESRVSLSATRSCQWSFLSFCSFCAADTLC
jgi:hypothetical protein